MISCQSLSVTCMPELSLLESHLIFCLAACRTHTAINQNTASLLFSSPSQMLPKSNSSIQNTTLHTLSFTFIKNTTKKQTKKTQIKPTG